MEKKSEGKKIRLFYNDGNKVIRRDCLLLEANPAFITVMLPRGITATYPVTSVVRYEEVRG